MTIGSQTASLPAIPHASDVEKRIVGKLVTDLLAKGYNLSVYDGEEFPLKYSSDPAAIFDALSSTDYDWLYAGDIGAVLLVWGNDCDVISDYTTKLEADVAGALALSEELEG